MQSKQSLIDQNHAKLREVTAQLSEEKRQLAEQQRRANDRTAIRQRVANLARANDVSRALVVEKCPGGIRTDVTVGEADAGLDVDMSRLPKQYTPVPGVPISQQLEPSQLEYLKKVPRTPMLQARTAAYRLINAQLEGRAKALQSQSSVLEGQLRKVVALCTATEESRVEAMVDGLCAAVESEAGNDVEVGRVREFLRRVEGQVGA